MPTVYARNSLAFLLLFPLGKHCVAGGGGGKTFEGDGDASLLYREKKKRGGKGDRKKRKSGREGEAAFGGAVRRCGGRRRDGFRGSNSGYEARGRMRDKNKERKDREIRKSRTYSWKRIGMNFATFDLLLHRIKEVDYGDG